MTRAALAACTPLLAMVAVVAFSCAAPADDGRLTEIKVRPDEGAFANGNSPDGPGAGVSYFLERRCGTLDCHGRIERPLRIYGNRGLRLPNDAGWTPSNGGTTDSERTANFRSVLGLEPEQMNRVMAGESPSILLIIQKPLNYDPDRNNTLGVRHRGGPQIVKDQDGYNCLVKWFDGTFNADTAVACKKAGDLLLVQ